MSLPNRILAGLKHFDMNDLLDRAGYEKKSSMMSRLVPALGLLIGGVGIGLLLAPRPGKETRKRLMAGAKDLAESAQELRENGAHLFSDNSARSPAKHKSAT